MVVTSSLGIYKGYNKGQYGSDFITGYMSINL